MLKANKWGIREHPAVNEVEEGALLFSCFEVRLYERYRTALDQSSQGLDMILAPGPPPAVRSKMPLTTQVSLLIDIETA